MTLLYILNWVIIPSIVAYLMTRYFLKRGTKIAALVSTEKQGDHIIVCFKMKSGKLKYYRVHWLSYMNCPNSVFDVQNFENISGHMHGAAQHAARIHMSKGERVEKNVYPTETDWRLLN